MSIRSIKETAKLALTGNWGIAIGVLFINYILASIIGRISEDYYILSLLTMFFISGPLFIGYMWFHLDIKRKQNPSVRGLFRGFTVTYFRNALTYFLMTIFLFLWSLLLIIPGIIKGLAYSMTVFILRDHPELTALQAISESRKMMNGKKKDLFLLSLSFFTWLIIPIILLVIGFVSIGVGFNADANLIFAGSASIIIGSIAMIGISIYVTPYYMTSLAVFYDDYVKPTENYITQGPISKSYDTTIEYNELVKPIE